MKPVLARMIHNALSRAFAQGDLHPCPLPTVGVEEPKIETHGHFSTNVAMAMASVQKLSPRKVAEAILAHMEDPEQILERAEIAGPGFINFFIRPTRWREVLKTIHSQADRFGAYDMGQGRKVQVEFVSANPTGPLHVGHGRGAAVGDSVANLLTCFGFDVQREYYINDSGTQIQTLGQSVYLRYLEGDSVPVAFPEKCYQGAYIKSLAEKIRKETTVSLRTMGEQPAIEWCARFAAREILEGIRKDLEDFGVVYDNWFGEQSLFDSGKVEKMIGSFRERGLIYEADGALWFRTTAYGDEKDRVVRRKTGLTTYFAPDIAYHQDKFDRGFERVIDVWGADHHGYVPRMAAAVEASGHSRDSFQVILVQLVNLLRDGVPVAMSTRAGEFVTLRDVMDEVGPDAARFLFLTRHYDSPLDFDLAVAKKQTNENPVYYVQYVHARIASIGRKAAETGIDLSDLTGPALELLVEPEEFRLLKQMSRYPEILEGAARSLEPHRITFFLMDLASLFHAYYNRHRVLTEEVGLTEARLFLVMAVQRVIRNGLSVLGVSAPQTM